MPKTVQSSRFVVCINNDGYNASLERRKIYRCMADADAEDDGDLRIVDESGEDYIYPAWTTPNHATRNYKNEDPCTNQPILPKI